MADFNKGGPPPNPHGYPPNPAGYQQGIPGTYPTGSQPMPVPETHINVNEGYHHHSYGAIVVNTCTPSSKHSYSTMCPNCNANILTAVQYKSGALTWILCLVIAFLGFILGCCLIPFCLNATKDVVHRCPRCNVVVAVHKRI